MANRQNYALKMELKRQNNAVAGLVSERFPTVSGMVINMTYYQKSVNPVLMTRTLNVFPTSYACFKMDCMIKGCAGGGFDLTSIINDMVKTHKKVKKGAVSCLGNVDTHPSEHASIEYETIIRYKKVLKVNH
ncbi:MAG: hypothetical protein M1147_00790 [Nitrospirae bacterium]|nr:hypothetical protein [Nitrospirota bacterium]MCL5976648.1 hypothetical protein [Nitrospirota bacterium]